MRNIVVICLLLMELAIHASCTSVSATLPNSNDFQALEIYSMLEMFVDYYLIDKMQNVELKLHHPQPAEIVIKFDKPWEGRYCGYVTVMKDDGVFRMYYRGLPLSRHGQEYEVTCYAESKDGITWTKPNVGLYEIQGFRENNVILAQTEASSHNFCPFLDARPGVPAAERYKAVGGSGKTGLVAYISEDGIHWKKLRDEPILTKGAFDSQNVSFWSERENCYVCYFRTWTEGEYKGFRTISRATSNDFLNWSEAVQMSFGDTPLEHLYTNQTQPYFRAPHLYVAVAARFMPNRRVVTVEQAKAFGGEARYSGDCSDGVLMTSRGGNQYDRIFMEGFIRPGIGLTNWTSRTNYPALGIVPTSSTEMSLYIQKNYGQLTHHLRRYRLRIDGFVSVNAPYEGGEMLTKPLKFAGRELVINYSTSAAGGLRVEMQDETGKPIPGYSIDNGDEIIGDEIERVVSWQGDADVSQLAGQPVRLRFVMKDADLYSLRFR